MILNFLNYNEARLEIRNSNYFYQFNQEELRIRLHMLRHHNHAQKVAKSGNIEQMRTTLINIYLENCLDYLPEEIEAINFCYQLIDQIIKNKTEGSFFVPNEFQVKLIKLNSIHKQLDWGYLFTLEESIVLPDNYLADLMTAYLTFYKNNQDIIQPTNTVKPVSPDFGILKSHLVNLYHEVIHLLQKTTKLSSIYNRISQHIYQQIWHFTHIEKGQLVGLSETDNFITNPDGFNFEWIIAIFNYQTSQNHFFLPSLVFDYRVDIPVGILIELKSLPNGQFQLINKWDRIELYPNYVKKFYGLFTQLYHPNEILAQLLSEYLVNSQTFNSHPDSFYFYDYINKYLLNSNNYYTS